MKILCAIMKMCKKLKLMCNKFNNNRKKSIRIKF